MLAGFVPVPLATPVLIWITLGANLPLELLTLQFITIAYVSDWLSHITVRVCGPAKTRSHHEPTSNAAIGNGLR